MGVFGHGLRYQQVRMRRGLSEELLGCRSPCLGYLDVFEPSECRMRLQHQRLCVGLACMQSGKLLGSCVPCLVSLGSLQAISGQHPPAHAMMSSSLLTPGCLALRSLGSGQRCQALTILHGMRLMCVWQRSYFLPAQLPSCALRTAALLWLLCSDVWKLAP